MVPLYKQRSTYWRIIRRAGTGLLTNNSLTSMAFTSTLSSASSASPFVAKTDGQSSVALRDKLARCIRQLGDWEACPSSKTSEGKQIIQNLQTQIRNLEARMVGNDQRTASQPLNSVYLQGQAQVGNGSPVAGPSLIGHMVDVFA